MKRREFIAALGGAAAWPLAARAQQPAMPKVGWLTSVSPESTPLLPFFKQGLADLGFIEGRNVTFEYAFASGRTERLPSLAADLVKANVAVIAAVSGAPSARAAKAATATIPIVFITPGDPVQQGLVTSLNRPDGNLTGLTMMNTLLTAKQIELMHETVPAGATIVVLSDPNVEGE
jgi:putative ABC transport system substrate-binding protein